MPPTLPELQKLTKTSLTTPMLQKLMPSQFLRRGPTLNIDTQTHTQKRLQLLTQPLGFLQSRRPVRCDKVQSFERLFVQVGRFALDHFDRHDAKRPNVDFAAVLLLLDDLRRHPVGRADHGGTFVALFGEFGAEAEIGDFDRAAAAEEHVVGFDVAVDDVLGVEVDETFACLSYAR